MIIPDPHVLRLRHIAAQAIRSHFLQKHFCEVDSPLQIPAPAPELHIVAETAGAQYLRTSPELHMKRMLAAGCQRIFQLGPCFRAHEYGTRHRPEFMMLEWYRTNADYMTILADMQELLPHVANTVRQQLAMPHSNAAGDTEAVCKSHTKPQIDATSIITAPWEVKTIQQIYKEKAGWDPVNTFDHDRFNLDMINIIEPALTQDRCTVLMDYPAPVAALARRKPGNHLVAERWELYAGSLELANAFTELTDPIEQRQRFQEALNTKATLNEPCYPLDEPFLEALVHGLPPCAGVALGFDRLLMALTASNDIATVLSFPNQ